MHPFEVVADPVRRQLITLLAHADMPAGDLVAAVQATTAMSQPAVSQHLRVLREAGIATAITQGRSRIYSLHPEAPQLLASAVAALFPPSRGIGQSLDALHTEVARGKREARAQTSKKSQTATNPTHVATLKEAL